MDMMEFDGRKKAEDGLFVPLSHPYTGKPFSKGKDAPGFYVRGAAARSVQSRLAEMRREAKANAERGDDEGAVMEALHERLIDAAMKYIVRADDAMKYDGHPVGDDPDMIRKVLDSTFPDMRVARDADGNIIKHDVMMPALDAEGKDTGKKEPQPVPKYELSNKTWAQQIIEAAEDGSRFFGKTSTG